MLSVRFVPSEKDIPPELWERSFPPQLEGRWWYGVLEDSGLEDQFTFLYGVIEDDGRAVGVAPMFVMSIELDFLVPKALLPFLAWLGRMLPALSAPRGLFIGSPCSDEGAVGVLPGVDRRAALLALQRAVEAEAARRKAGLVVWKDFPESYDADLGWLAKEAGLFRMVGFPGTAFTVPDGTRDGYFAMFNARGRNKLKKKLKKSREAFDAVVEVVSNPDDATLDEVHALFRQTRAKAKTSFEELDRRFFARVAREPVAHFLILRERGTGKAVAFKLMFLLGDHLIDKYIGIDYSRPKDWFLFFRLMDEAIDWGLAHGARSFQCGQTGYSGKLEQGYKLYPLSVYAKHRNATFHRICAAVVSRIGWDTLDDDLSTYLRAHPEARRG